MDKQKIYHIARIANFAFSFGITSVIALLLGFWGGSWLDKKLSTSPVFMVIGLFLGVAVTFQALFSELKVLNTLEEISSNDGGEDKDEGSQK